MVSEDGTARGRGARGTFHDVLASETRREVLRHVLAREGRVTTLDELADVVVDRDGGVDEPSRARIRLHHCDLPKLAETRVIEYDPRSEAVRYRGRVALEGLLRSGAVARGE